MTIYPVHFFASQRKRLMRWVGGLVACAALASAGATDATPPAAEPAPTAAPVVAPASRPAPPSRPVAIPAPKPAPKPAPAASKATQPPASKPESSAPKTEPAPVGTALVRVADGRLLAPDIARIVNRGELVVAMLGVDTPPFFFETTAGVLSGLEVDLAHEIAQELKVKVRFDRSAKSFNDVVDIVARQQADLGISKLSRTLARAQVVRFSDPYLTLNHALILNRVAFARMAVDKPVSQVVRSFNGTIGVIAKSSFADFAVRNFPNAKVRTYPGWPEVIKAVSSGEVMSAYRDEFEIKRVLKSDPSFALTLRTVTFKDVEDTLGIAVGVADPTLLAFVNQFLGQRKEQLDIKKVLQALDH